MQVRPGLRRRLLFWGAMGLALCAARLPASALPAYDTTWREADRSFWQRLCTDPRGVLDQSEQAHELSRQVGDDAGVWTAAANMAAAARWLGPEIGSRVDARAESALVAARAGGDQPALLNLLVDRAMRRLAAARVEEAQDLLAQADRAAQALGDPARLVAVDQARGDLLVWQGRSADALPHFAEAMENAPHDYARASILLSMARAQQRGTPSAPRLQAALDLAARAMELVPPASCPALGLGLLQTKGQIESALKRYAASLVTYRQALDLATELHLQGRTDGILLDLSALLLRQQQPDEALKTLDRMQQGSRSWDPEVAFLMSLRRADALAQKADGQAEGWLSKAHELLPQLAGRAALQEQYLQIEIKVLAAFGRFKEALGAAQAHSALTAELSELANDELRQELQTRYDVTSKEQENALLRQRRDLLGWSLGASLLLVVMVLFTVIVQLRQKLRLRVLSAQLVRHNVSLQSINDERIRLLAAACHDLRQPAHALGLLAELVVDQVDDQQRNARLEGIRRASATLANMLDMMLAVTQLEGGHESPQITSVSLDELMKEIELQYGALANRKGLHLRLPTTGLSVRSDRNLLRRILFNLVSNAVKYTPHGGVTIKLRCHGPEVDLIVEDTGSGIVPQRHVDVFGYFVRLNITAESEGLGVGLPIVKRAAQLLGHALQLRSKPGEGTAVSITLPIADRSAPAEASGQGETELQGLGRLVLVLEDDPESRQALTALLRRWEFVVFAASSLAVLVRQLQERPGALPDLIISDQHMGVENGMEHIKALRARQGWADVPAVLMTGDLDAELADQAQRNGVVLAYKPLLPARLKITLATALAETAGRKEARPSGA